MTFDPKYQCKIYFSSIQIKEYWTSDVQLSIAKLKSEGQQLSVIKEISSEIILTVKNSFFIKITLKTHDFSTNH